MISKSFGVGITSYQVFLYFATESQECGVARVLSKECYETWLATRRVVPDSAHEVFRRHITAHLTGTRKRCPFPQEIEADLLQVVRKCQVWPCFAGLTNNKHQPIEIGKNGFRSKGYHEQRQNNVTRITPEQPAVKTILEQEKPFFSEFEPLELEIYSGNQDLSGDVELNENHQLFTFLQEALWDDNSSYCMPSTVKREREPWCGNFYPRGKMQRCL
mmetsp:Transcript_9437/g.15424  ORF Transcript_9437/g.15424 Transcript_9437/m.15424 type:complete len:217 (+) Transcript_9437:230-880(+)